MLEEEERYSGDMLRNAPTTEKNVLFPLSFRFLSVSQTRQSLSKNMLHIIRCQTI